MGQNEYEGTERIVFCKRCGGFWMEESIVEEIKKSSLELIHCGKCGKILKVKDIT